MLTPIHKDHEVVCPGCGAVLSNITDYAERSEKLSIPTSSDLFLLGSVMENNLKYANPRTSQQYYEERMLRHITFITKEFGLPDSIAVETFRILKKKRQGFRSESRVIKQLLQVLSKDDNYLFIHKMRAIKSKYESICD